MAIFTPTGLKIRLSIENAFGLMARLFPRITPFRFMKSVEGLELLPSVFAFIAGLICFFGNHDPYIIGTITFVSYLIGLLSRTFGVFDKSIISLGIFYSYLSGYGIFIILTCIIGYSYSGIHGLIGFFSAKFVGYLLSLLFDLIYTNHAQKKYGYPFTASERSFFNVYDFYAYKLKVNPSLSSSDEELKEQFWGDAYNHLAKNWPQVVNRFTTDE